MQSDIRQHVDCKSKNVIYPDTCNKCKVQYVGSTFNEFKIRFRNHKSAMSTIKQTTCEVALSILTKTNINYLTLNSLQLSKICNINEKSRSILAYVPNYALFNLKSLINKRSEFNSKNRILKL